MTKKNVTKNAARERQERLGGHYQAHLRTVEEQTGRCGGCFRLVSAEQEKCECGWILRGGPLECLEREDLSRHQREAIELELEAVAQAGPQGPKESREQYAERLQRAMRAVLEGRGFEDDWRAQVDDETAFYLELQDDD